MPRTAPLACLASLAALFLARAAEPTPATEAERLWEQGQQALLDGQAERAIALYRQSLVADPALVRNHLSLAAALLERGDDRRAAFHLDVYLQRQPDHVAVRGQYADLLLRLGDDRAARSQLERYAADLQADPDLAARHLVDAHTRLLRLAVAQGDAYGEHLHRGIGLYRLACAGLGLADTPGAPEAEVVLCRAAAELGRARTCRPAEARPCLYLHLTWARLGQAPAARRWLAEAAAKADTSALTPEEKRQLHRASEGRRLGAARE